jgi:transposase-like protein
MRRSRFHPLVDLGRSAFCGFRFPPEIIVLAVRWYLRYGLSYRDLETVIEEVAPNTFHNTDQYANNRVECDHGRLKARLRPMRGLKTDRTAQVVIAGHAFMQNVRRGHYELGVEAESRLRVSGCVQRAHRDDLTPHGGNYARTRHVIKQCNGAAEPGLGFVRSDPR